MRRAPSTFARYPARMGALRRLAHMSVWRHAGAGSLHPGWSAGTAGLSRGISYGPAGPQISEPEPGSSVSYSLELDVGEVVLGHRLIVLVISLTAERLFFEYAFIPEVTEAERDDVFLNMFTTPISRLPIGTTKIAGPLDGGASAEGARALHAASARGSDSD